MGRVPTSGAVSRERGKGSTQGSTRQLTGEKKCRVGSRKLWMQREHDGGKESKGKEKER